MGYSQARNEGRTGDSETTTCIAQYHNGIDTSFDSLNDLDVP